MKRSDGDYVSAIVLAAGTASRYGEAKQLLSWHGKPLVRHVVDTAAASDVDAMLVVIGNERDRVRAALAGSTATIVENPDYADGQSTSLQHGLREIPAETSAIVMLVGDQPGITSTHIDRVVSAWRATRAPIVQAAFEGVPSHPTLFSIDLLAELLRVTGDEGARGVVQRCRDTRVLVEMNEPAPPDIDTPEDYHRALGGTS